MKTRHWFCLAAGLAIVIAPILLILILKPEGVALWWEHSLDPKLRPWYSLVSSAALVTGTLWAARVLDLWRTNTRQRPPRVHIIGPILVIFLGLWVTVTATQAPLHLRVETVLADGNALIALSQNGHRVWIRNLPSAITDIGQIEDLNGDGLREIVVATVPDGARSSKLLIFDEHGRIVFDSDYIVWVSTEKAPGAVRVPYQDLVMDDSGRVVQVRKPDGELTGAFTWDNAWDAQRIPYYGLPGGTYELQDFLVGNVDTSPSKEIVYVANARYVEGLSLIGKLSPSGEPVGSYWHPGPIREIVLLEDAGDDRANIVAVGENSFLRDHDTFNVVFGLAGQLLVEASCWNLLTPDDLSLPYEEQLQKVPGVALCRGYHEVLRWFRWISPSEVRVSEITTSYRPLWRGPKLGLGGSEPTIDLTLSDGSYFGLDAQGELLYGGGPGAASLERRQ